MPKKASAAASGRRASAAREAPAAIWIAASLLAALLPWAVWPGGGTRDPYVDLKWPIAFAGITALAAIALAQRRQRSAIAEDPVAAGGGLFYAGAGLVVAGLILSSAFSSAPGLGFKVSLREIAFVAAACLLTGRAATKADVGSFAGAYLVSAVLQAALVFAQWVPSDGARLTGRAAMIGTFGNPEHAGGWLAPAMAVAVVWFVHAPARALPRALLGSAALILGLALVLGGGRGAALGASAGVVLALGVPSGLVQSASGGERLRRFAPMAAFVLLLLLAIGAVVILSPGARRQSLGGRMAEMFDPYSISVRHRIGLVVVTSRMIEERPMLGAGPGRFAAAFDLARGRLAKESAELGPWAFNELLGDQSANEAHCDPLQWWAEYGLASFIGFLLMLTSAIAGLARAARAAGSSDALAARLLLSILTTFAVGMMFSFPLHRPARATLFWIALGLGMALARSMGAKPPEPLPSPNPTPSPSSGGTIPRPS